MVAMCMEIQQHISLHLYGGTLPLYGGTYSCMEGTCTGGPTPVRGDLRLYGGGPTPVWGDYGTSLWGRSNTNFQIILAESAVVIVNVVLYRLQGKTAWKPWRIQSGTCIRPSSLSS